MKKENETPLTDAASYQHNGLGLDVVDANFARNLERQLADSVSKTEMARAIVELESVLQRLRDA